MDASEYKHVALGLIFLKYISDRFEERQAKALTDPEEVSFVDERDLYVGDNVFWVPEGARWDYLKANATSTDPTIGALIDRAMLDLEAENPSLKGVLTKNFARPELDQTKLGEVIKLFSDLTFQDKHHGRDMLGRVYEYFLGQFAVAEGKRGGQLYIAGCVVQLLVEMLQPFKGRVYDSCCGSGGMFVQSERFVEAHNGRRNDVSIFGQESNPTTWRLAKMNLAIAASRRTSGRSGGTASTRICIRVSRRTSSSPTPLSTIVTGAASCCAPAIAGSTAFPRSATRTSLGYSTSSTILPPMATPASCWRTAPCRASSQAKGRSGGRSSTPIWSIASSACRGGSFSRRRYPSAVDFR